MDCRTTRAELMATADVGDAASLDAAVRAHLEACAECRALLAKLRRLEATATAAPVPAELLAAKDRVLAAARGAAAATGGGSIAGHPGPTVPPRPRRNVRIDAAVLGAAAMLALGVTLGAWLAPQRITVVQTSDPVLVSDLVDWNLQLARAHTDDRQWIYTERASTFADRTRRASLPLDDRELVDALMANGSWLRSHDQPLDELDRFDDLADRVIRRIEALRSSGERDATARLAAAYAALVDQGVNANLDRAIGGPDAQVYRRRFADMSRDATRHTERLQGLLNHVPDEARPGIERALANQARKIAADPNRRMPPGLVRKLATRPASRKDDD